MTLGRYVSPSKERHERDAKPSSSLQVFSSMVLFLSSLWLSSWSSLSSSQPLSSLSPLSAESRMKTMKTKDTVDDVGIRVDVDAHSALMVSRGLSTRLTMFVGWVNAGEGRHNVVGTQVHHKRRKVAATGTDGLGDDPPSRPSRPRIAT